jgi:hypothetical protein
MAVPDIAPSVGDTCLSNTTETCDSLCVILVEVSFTHDAETLTMLTHQVEGYLGQGST